MAEEVVWPVRTSHRSGRNPQIHLPSVDTGLTFDGAWLVRIGRVNSGNLDASLIDMVAGQVSQNIMAVFLAVDISTHGRINSMRGLAGPS